MSVYRTTWQRDWFKRVGQGAGVCSLPLLGKTQIKVLDGKAVLIPERGSGVITRDWFDFCRWLQRRGQVRF